jgi:hypothetical protein
MKRGIVWSVAPLLVGIALPAGADDEGDVAAAMTM